MKEFGINMTQIETEKPVKEKKSEEPVKAESKLPQNAREKLGKDAPQPRKVAAQAPVALKPSVTPADLEKPQMKGGYSQGTKIL